jgi:hypothetical protein
MTHEQIISALVTASFDTGWVVSGDKIVMWLNDEPVPKKLEKYLQLDEV